MSKKMICGGCGANINLARPLPLLVWDGRLVIECPLCTWNQNVILKDWGGTIEVLLMPGEEGGCTCKGWIEHGICNCGGEG